MPQIYVATFQTVGWTLDELIEEAEDQVFLTRDHPRRRDLTIVCDLVALLRTMLEPSDARST